MPQIYILETPVALPGCCFLCGGVSDRDWFIDTGRTIEFEGAIYICNICFHSIATIVGYLPQDEVSKKTAENLSLRIRIDELERANKHLENGLHELLSSRAFGVKSDSDISEPTLFNEPDSAEPNRAEESTRQINVSELDRLLSNPVFGERF